MQKYAFLVFLSLCLTPFAWSSELVGREADDMKSAKVYNQDGRVDLSSHQGDLVLVEVFSTH